MASATKQPKWREISQLKQDGLLSTIPEEWRIPKHIVPPEEQLDVTAFPNESGWFTEKELKYTNVTANVLLQNLQSGTWSAEEVVRAFCKRAAVAHQLTNCLSETLFPEAIERARMLDDYLRQHGKPVGPLHGLPISLKDNFNIIGKDTTVGFTSFAQKPAAFNSVLVELLQDAGAVFFVKTNVPTAMMIAETVNNVFGRTVNPLNRKLTSGGSSGGETALIAFGGSPLGVGSDIGGSLRIPAACTGLFTLRPSFGRFPGFGVSSGLPGQEAVHAVNGPLGRTLSDVLLYSKTVIEARPWLHDPKCIPIPWRPIERKQRLKLGVLWDDGIVTPTPPVQRALQETVKKLREAGHEVIDWAPDGHQEALQLLVRMFLADGGQTLRKILEPTDEPFRPEMNMYEIAKELGASDMWRLHLQRNEILKKYLDRWNEHDLDGLIAPTTPYSSVAHGNFRHVGYTGVFNILDYSAVSLPVGIQADRELDIYSEQFVPLSDVDAEVRKLYDADIVHGMPVSLQLVGRRLEEEKVLMMTEVVLKSLQLAYLIE